MALFDSAFLRKLDRLSLLTHRAMQGTMQGERRSTHHGSSVEFADFRPYTPGDDIRQIDWNLYARLDRVYLKLFVAEEELTVHLLVDTSASMNWGEPNKFAYAIRTAAAMGYMALTSTDRVTVTAFGDGTTVLPGVRGKRNTFTLFHFFEQLTPGGSNNIARMCRRYMQAARVPGPLILCSDLLDPTWQDGLRALLSRPFDVTVIHILAPQELNPSLEGDLRLVDNENGQPIDITADGETLRRYRNHVATWQAEVAAFCRGSGIRYVPVESSTPLETFLFDQLRQRGTIRA